MQWASRCSLTLLKNFLSKMKNFISLCIFFVIMMVGMASCCAPSSDNVSQGATQTVDGKRIPDNLISIGTITDVEIVHKHASDFCINFVAFTYNGHRYIKYTSSDVLMHAPNCPCFKTETGSVLDSPLFNTNSNSSSLWDW